MKILILGGTGAMGSHLVELFANTETEVFVTSRRGRESKYTNISYFTGDAMDLDFLRSILVNKWDAIVDFMAYSTGLLASRYELFLNSTDQYIFLSSSRVYANSEEPLTETSPRLLDISIDKQYLQTDEYAIAKARQEDIFIKSNYENWTIIRPYITYAEDRLQLGNLEKESWLSRAVLGKRVILIDDIYNKNTTLTYGLDVAKGIKAIIGKKETLGHIFHITSNKTIKWSDVADIYMNVLEEHFGKRPLITFVDSSKLIDIGYLQYQIIYDRIYNRRFDNSKISNFINVEDFTDPKDGLGNSLRSFLENKKFGKIYWGLVGREDKLTNEYTPICKIGGFKNKIVYTLCRYTPIRDNKK